MKEKKVAAAQAYLRAMKADGWLLYDFHRNNYLAHLFLEIPSHMMTSRRFFYWIPAHGQPVRIVHAIESEILDEWPGEKRTFLSWQSLEQQVGAVIKGTKRVAMEYSPKNGNPYISHVDGGTIDLVRSFGAEVVSSGEFLSHFTAVINASQGESHIRAGQALNRIALNTWKWIGDQLRQNKPLVEYDVLKKIARDIDESHLMADELPLVSVGAHSAAPHYRPLEKGSSPIRKGDFILIDLWGKEKQEGAVYGDITRVAVAADRPTERQKEIFQIVRSAQKAGIELVKRRFSEKKRVMGFEIDDAVRKVVRDAGYGDYFLHRTGHNIEEHIHGSGANIDNLEMHDERPILPGTCFSVEPGIYLPGEFGIRLESDVYVHLDGRVEVTGGEQDEIFCIG